jgi:hypothetical protein
MDRVTRWMVDCQIFFNKFLLRIDDNANYRDTVKAFAGNDEIALYARSKLRIGREPR